MIILHLLFNLTYFYLLINTNYCVSIVIIIIIMQNSLGKGKVVILWPVWRPWNAKRKKCNHISHSNDSRDSVLPGSNEIARLVRKKRNEPDNAQGKQ